jgi:hypothetical protein
MGNLDVDCRMNSLTPRYDFMKLDQSSQVNPTVQEDFLGSIYSFPTRPVFLQGSQMFAGTLARPNVHFPGFPDSTGTLAQPGVHFLGFPDFAGTHS